LPPRFAISTRRNRENKRERYLSQDGARQLIEVVNQHPDPRVRNLIMFLLTTGARRGEALASTWTEFTNPDIDPIVWTKPSAHTKSVRPITLRLIPPLLL
jgi:integrase